MYRQIDSNTPIRASWVSGITLRGVGLNGGRLLLTADELIFTPIDLDKFKSRLGKGSSVAKAALNPNLSEAAIVLGLDLIQDIGIDALTDLKRMNRVVVIPLPHIVAVEPLNYSEWWGRVPVIRIRLIGGESKDFAVLARFRGSILARWRAEHDRTLDSCVATIRAAIGK